MQAREASDLLPPTRADWSSLQSHPRSQSDEARVGAQRIPDRVDEAEERRVALGYGAL
jgi:hypothetical protein